jgi:O-antigen/teichoic acid export membrane protein
MNFLKSFSIYGASSLLNAGLPFFLLPILTIYLTPSDYGLLSIIQIFILLAVPFISINIAATIQAEYNKKAKAELASLVSSVLLIPLFTLTVFSLVFFLAESVIRRFLEISTAWILIIPLIAFFHVVPRLVLSLFQMSEQPIKFGAYQVSLAIVNLGLSIMLVVFLLWGWEGRVWAIFVSYALFTAIGLGILNKSGLLTTRLDTQYMVSALRVGAPLIIHVISAALFMMSDRLFISYFLGNESVGLYSVGAQIAMIAMLVQQTFNQAWVPYLFRHLSTNNMSDKIKIVRISYIVLLGFCILPFAIHLMSGPLYTVLVDDSFAESIIYVFWISLGYSFLGMYKVFTNYIFFEKKTHILAIMTFGSLLLNLLLNYFFIQAYGAIGVAYATALTVGVFFVMAAIVAAIVHPMPWFSFRTIAQ